MHAGIRGSADNCVYTCSYQSLSSAPYHARSTNRGVVALNILIFLAGCTAEAIALEVGSEVALVLQQVFGVCSAVVVLGTLCALTPLGSLIFNDGKVQRFSTIKPLTPVRANPLYE